LRCVLPVKWRHVKYYIIDRVSDLHINGTIKIRLEMLKLSHKLEAVTVAMSDICPWSPWQHWYLVTISRLTPGKDMEPLPWPPHTHIYIHTDLSRGQFGTQNKSSDRYERVCSLHVSSVHLIPPELSRLPNHCSTLRFSDIVMDTHYYHSSGTIYSTQNKYVKYFKKRRKPAFSNNNYNN
jgi:hypothetical protein